MKYLTRTTKRLVIRPLEKGDYQAWKEHFLTMNKAQNIWDLGPKPEDELTPKKFKAIITNQQKLRKEDRFYDLGVFEKKSKALIGSVAAMDVLRGIGQTAYLGYFLHNDFWGKGYGKEAARAMIDIAFRDIKIHRIEAGIEPYNRRSIMLARSLGLRKEGLKKRAVYLRKEWQDLVIYSATCEEFNIKWKSAPKTRLR